MTNLEHAVLSSLPSGPPGARPREIWRVVRGWAPSTIRNALWNLVEAGHVEFSGPPCSRRYWRQRTYSVVGIARDGTERVLIRTPSQDLAVEYALAKDMRGLEDVVVRRES